MPTDKALARIHAQLWNVIHGRREVVDGVDIDLRHELVPPDDWRPNLSLTFGTTPEPPWRAPFIWFPWFGCDPAWKIDPLIRGVGVQN